MSHTEMSSPWLEQVEAQPLTAAFNSVKSFGVKTAAHNSGNPATSMIKICCGAIELLPFRRILNAMSTIARRNARASRLAKRNENVTCEE